MFLGGILWVEGASFGSGAGCFFGSFRGGEGLFLGGLLANFGVRRGVSRGSFNGDGIDCQDLKELSMWVTLLSGIS